MKLFIIGPAGSGKTTLANKLSAITSTEYTNLDDLFWCNENGFYGKKRNDLERSDMLNKALQKDSWIIEGVYVEWPKKAIEESDVLIFLNLPKYLVSYRIIKRFLRRKLKIEASTKKETWKNTTDLLKWNMKQIGKIKSLIKAYELSGKNIVALSSNSDISDMVNRYK